MLQPVSAKNALNLAAPPAGGMCRQKRFFALEMQKRHRPKYPIQIQQKKKQVGVLILVGLIAPNEIARKFIHIQNIHHWKPCIPFFPF